MGYNYLSTDTDAEHCERYGVDETSEETRWCGTCNVWEPSETVCEKAEAARLAEEQARVVKPVTKPIIRRQTLICSCGSKTCAMIVHFGLTERTFSGEIYPIPSQVIRDTRAREIKAGGGL